MHRVNICIDGLFNAHTDAHGVPGGAAGLVGQSGGLASGYEVPGVGSPGMAGRL